MNNPFFSIVMPVYNGERYVVSMIKGIQEQTYEDWELLVVDDCSTDQSREIVLRLSTEDPRIRLVALEQNGGVSAARNRGIQEACGSYIWFADADDNVDRDLLERVWKSLQKNRAKMVIFGLVEEYYDRNEEFQYLHKVFHEEKFFCSKELLRPEMIHLERETLYGYPWNKVYELEYLKKIGVRFTDYNEAKFIEDIKFNVEYCMDIDSLNILSFCPYHYAKRVQGNLTSEYVAEYYKFHKRRIELLYEQYQYWELCDMEVKGILGGLYARYILSALQRNCDKRAGMTYRMRYEWAVKLLKEPLFCELIEVGQAKDSKSLSILLRLLQMKSPLMCLAMGRGIHIIKKMNPVIFSKTKSKR